MNQTTKVTYVAWAVHDYYVSDESLHENLRGKKIRHLPSLKEYMSFVFTFLGFCGPFVDYRDHQDFIMQENKYKNIKISGEQFIFNLGQLVFMHVVFLGFQGFFPFDLIGTAEYQDTTFGYKILF